MIKPFTAGTKCSRWTPGGVM